MVLAETFNIYTLGVAIVALAALALILLAGRAVSVRFGRMEAGIEEVSRQVNHVEDPDTEPTIREVVIAMHEQVTDTRSDVSELKRDQKQTNRRLASLEASQLAQGERLGEVGRLARSTADMVRQHHAEHETPDDDTEGET